MTYPSTDALIEQAEIFFARYLDVYFRQRDFEAVSRMLLPGMSGSGTGYDELSFGDTSFLDLFWRDIQQAPNTVDFTVKNKKITRLADNCAVVFAVMDITTVIAGQRFWFRSMRMTLVVARRSDEFQIGHLHVSFPTVEHGDDEAFPVKELEERNSVLMRLVDERTKQLESLLEENSRLLITDKLTGLSNRRMLDERLQQELRRCERYASPLSVIFLDIDHFKGINDLYGHLAGDHFLISFSALVAQRLRKTDVFGRWGGEEFLIVCTDTTIDEASLLAEQIRAKLEVADFGLDAMRTVSIGITAYRCGDDEEQLIRRADRMLYAAKQRGRNRICRSDHEPEIDRQSTA
jgi:diguanylate cyclase (GGDEF)-like protein